MNPAFKPIPYELRLGVTGHRNLPQPAEVAVAVEKLLQSLRESLQAASAEPRGKCGPKRTPWQRVLRVLGHGVKLVWRQFPLVAEQTPTDWQTPLEWTVISPLAKGADRIVAAALLKRPGARLEFVSPFALDEYRQDFADPQDRASFEELYSQAELRIELPAELGGATEDKRQANRNVAYLDVGRKIVDECEFLIAIWNGKPAAGLGGTGDVVHYALQTERTVIWINSDAPQAPPRTLHLKSQPLAPGTHEKRHASGDEQPVLEDIVSRRLPTRGNELSPSFHQLSAYNRDPAWDSTQSEEIYNRSYQEMMLAGAEARLPDRWLQNVGLVLLPHYARADQLAARYQQLYVLAASWLFYLSAAAVTVSGVQNLIFRDWHGLVLVEIGCMVATLFLLGLSQQGAYHVKWLNDRLLAEHLRVALFSTVANIRDTASAARRNPNLPFYRSPDNWVFNVVDQLIDQCPESNFGEPGDEQYLPALRAFLLNSWIRDQAKWHARNHDRKHAAAHRAHRLGLCLFVTTLILACIHLTGFGHHEAGDSGGHAHGHSVEHSLAVGISVLAIVLPAWGAAVHAINTLLERERIAERSGRMSSVLQAIAGRLESANTLEEIQIEIRRARDVTLAENHEWLASLSFRPPVLPG